MTSKRGGLVADPLHQAAVAAEDIGVVVDDLVAEFGRQVALGRRHTDGVGQPLAERPGCHLDAAGVAAFRMPSGTAAELAETLQLIERHVGVARQVQQRVKQHAAVPVGHHETVAIGPVRCLRIEAQELGEEHRGDVGHAHRHAGTTRFCLFDRIHRERPDGVGHAAEFRVPRSGEQRGRSGRSVTAALSCREEEAGSPDIGDDGAGRAGWRRFLLAAAAWCIVRRHRKGGADGNSASSDL
jgi:hypothetical protein